MSAQQHHPQAIATCNLYINSKSSPILTKLEAFSTILSSVLRTLSSIAEARSAVAPYCSL